MELPTQADIPQWLRDIILVTPQEPPSISGPDAARASLRELKVALTNPFVAYALGRLAVAFLEVQAEIVDHKFQGVHDVMNQQQLIGELRGLRRPMLELDEAQTNLIKAIH